MCGTRTYFRDGGQNYDDTNVTDSLIQFRCCRHRYAECCENLCGSNSGGIRFWDVRTISVESTIGWIPMDRGAALVAPFLSVAVCEKERRTDRWTNRVWWSSNEKQISDTCRRASEGSVTCRWSSPTTSQMEEAKLKKWRSKADAHVEVDRLSTGHRAICYKRKQQCLQNLKKWDVLKPTIFFLKTKWLISGNSAHEKKHTHEWMNY